MLAVNIQNHNKIFKYLQFNFCYCITTTYKLSNVQTAALKTFREKNSSFLQLT